jgi:hypothetical protein
VAKTSKDACPGCGTKFYIGDLPTMAELDRFRRQGVVNLGTPVPQVTCPKCEAKLKVSLVRMGNFFSMTE